MTTETSAEISFMEQATEQIITIECQVCGMPLNLPFTPVKDASLNRVLLEVAKNTVHDMCWNKRNTEKSAAEENQRVLQRSADWRLLCPAQYQDSPEWIGTSEATRLNVVSVRLALEWKYGATGLTMHGKKSGTGKTTTAWVLCAREFLAGRFIVATSHKEMSDKATWMARELTPESKRWQETLKNCDLLFVDDLGKSRFKSQSGESRASEEFLFDVVDERIKAKLPTIFTVNMTGDELRLAMSSDKGAYFVRRLKEFFTSVKFDAGGQES